MTRDLTGLIDNLASGPTGLVVGGLVGLLLSVMFEEPLRRLIRRTRRVWRRVLPRRRSTPSTTHFTWGGIRTTFLLVEGSGEEVIDEQRVRTRVLPGRLKPPPTVEAWREEVIREQRARRRAGRPHFWNGESYAIERFTVTRSPREEEPEVTLTFRETDYFTFLAVQQLDRDLGDGTTLRQTYLDGRNPVDEVPTFMSCSLGMNMAVVTADDRLIFSRRSADVGSRPGSWNSSANEALSKIDADGRRGPSLYGAARRGMREELAFQEDEYSIDLLGFGIDCGKHQWAALFIAELHSVTAAEFTERATRGVSDKWEHQTFDTAPFEVRQVMRYLHHPDRRHAWAPTAPALFYLALVHRHGRHAVERATRRERRRLRSRGIG